MRCTCRQDYAARCGLTPVELAYTAASIEGRNDVATALRHLVDSLVAEPVGWLTLWGGYGSAKTLCIQAIIAGLVRAGCSARFYHAAQVEQGWFADLHGDSMNGHTYETTPYLAIDELDKCNLKSDWIKQRFQALLDYRYRQAVAGKQLTLITLNSEPKEHIPGDIVSRMNDGRFCRPWPHGPNALTIDRWGERVLPGCIQIKGPDARPMLAPAFVRQKRKV